MLSRNKTTTGVRNSMPPPARQRTSPPLEEPSYESESDTAWEPDYIPVKLRNKQVTASKNIFVSCMANGIAYNSTPTGGGKTPMSMKLAQDIMVEFQQDVKIMVVGPSSLRDVNETSPWARESKRYNMHVDKYLSYQELHGKKEGNVIKQTSTGRMPKIPGQISTRGYDDIVSDFIWVDEAEYEDYYNPVSSEIRGMTYSDMGGVVCRRDLFIDGDWVVEFSPTMQIMQYFMEGSQPKILFIEEIQSAKNDTVTNNATAAIIRAARRAYAVNKNVFVCMLSASPVDSEKNSLNFFKLVGTSDPVHSSIHDMFVTGDKWLLMNAYEQSREFSESCAESVAASSNINSSNTVEVHKKATDLLNKCVMPKIHFGALVITPKQRWNAFLEIKSPEDRKLMAEAEKKFKEVTEKQAANKKNEAFKSLGEAKQLTELGMAEPVTLDAIKRLNRDPDCKCLIVFDHILSVNKSIRVLDSHGYRVGGKVARIAGVKDSHDDLNDEIRKGTTSKDTDKAIRKFQENNNSLRVIVAITSRVSTGIDAHDTHGNHQRWTYELANYDRLKAEQIDGRTPRTGSMSIPQIMVCYPKDLGDLIMRVYKSYQTKSEVLARALGSRINKASTEEERIIHDDLVKTPDKYDVYVQLPCEELSYYQGSPSYNYITKKVEPVDADNHFWIGEKTAEGRALFRNIQEMIKFLEGQCLIPPNKRSNYGIIFTKPASPTVVPVVDQEDD